MPVRQRRFTAALWFLILLMPCALVYAEDPSWHAGGAAYPPAVVYKKNEKITIGRILDAAAHTDNEVTVEGVFHGWMGECPSSDMLTRSDWILEDETGCIYITGRMPDNVSPRKPRSERILVTGRVVMSKDGKPVIKADQVTQIPKKQGIRHHQ